MTDGNDRTVAGETSVLAGLLAKASARGGKREERIDVAVIGGGPAGLTAATYAAQARLKTVLFEKNAAGGLMTTTDVIRNYPGFPGGVTGGELSQRFEEQARASGAELVGLSVDSVRLSRDGDHVVSTFRADYHARAVIIATGSRPRTLGLAHEDDYLFGRGISFCAVCDAAACRGLPVAVVGAGKSAVEEALYLARYASKVYLVVRRGEREAACGRTLLEQAAADPRIEFLWRSRLTAYQGESHLERIVVETPTNDGDEASATTERTLDVHQVFLYIGFDPDTKQFTGQIELDGTGHVVTDRDLSTGLPGVYAVGDVRNTKVRQIATAVGDGAYAAVQAERYLLEHS